MIVRTWRGATRTADADRYVDYIDGTGLRAYSETPGNLGSLILRRRVEGAGEPVTEFLVISFWESEDAVKGFAGDNPTVAVFYPEDDAFLVRRDVTVDHYDVAARRPGRDGAQAF
jgi:heme-degrading monooxygenase HmoA